MSREDESKGTTSKLIFEDIANKRAPSADLMKRKNKGRLAAYRAAIESDLKAKGLSPNVGFSFKGKKYKLPINKVQEFRRFHGVKE